MASDPSTTAQTARLCERPAGDPAIRFRWLDLLFMHWSVPVEQITQLVPPQLSIDTFDGYAWVGLVPFTMREIKARRFPLLPGMRQFHECNVRTYVTCNGEPGVWFFSLDATHRIAAWGARQFWRLNYFFSNIDITISNDEKIEYNVTRRNNPDATLRCAWQPGERLSQSQPGELAYFLTERYMLYTIDRRGRVLRGRIHHRPWQLRDAELLTLDERLLDAAGISPVGDAPATLYHSDELFAEAWPLRRA